MFPPPKVEQKKPHKRTLHETPPSLFVSQKIKKERKSRNEERKKNKENEERKIKRKKTEKFKKRKERTESIVEKERLKGKNKMKGLIKKKIY